jgi:BetI-type transcriptional repressor, C-terminal
VADVAGGPIHRTNAKATARLATRAALLDAATRLLFRSPAADPVGALRPMDVVRAADPPRSNGAFYNIWPTQADFRRELLHHILSPARSELSEETTAAAARLFTDPRASLEQTFRLVANLNFDGLTRDTALRLKQALWTRHADDPDVRELLAGLYRGVSATLIPMYELLLVRSGRRMRAPFTLEHLATAVMGLAEGLYTRWAVQPEAVPDNLGPPPDAAADTEDGVHTDTDERWTFFASVAFTTFLGMTEPNPAAG